MCGPPRVSAPFALGISCLKILSPCLFVQVSQLVILHEDAADGKIVHDLTGPVKAVDAAVQNLVVVGVYA